MTDRPTWPLHPRPKGLDILSGYVRRLAGLYGVSYNAFCVNALRISLTDREVFSLRDPSDEVLERLSTGVGVPVADLRKLHPDTFYVRLNEEIEALVATPEGARCADKMFARHTSQMGIPLVGR